MPGVNKNDYGSMPGNTQPHRSSVHDYMQKYTNQPHQPLENGTDLLLRELIQEIRGLRNDIRQEVLHREVAKLPAPIKNAR